MLDELDPVALWPDELRAAFIAAWAQLSSPSKRSTADAGSYSYSYADLASVDQLVRPVLARHDLATTVDVVVVEQTVHVSHSLLHASGIGRTSWLSIEYGRGPQALGSAVTYLRRYQLLALFGLAPADDDDGRAAERPTTWPQRRDDVRQIGALFEQLDVPIDERRSIVEFEIGRAISSSDDLTSDEARRVLSTLDARLQQSRRVESTDSAADDERAADDDLDSTGSDSS